MFKAAFPYSQPEEEQAEKEYIKSLPHTADEEVAGNVWIHPDQGTLHSRTPTIFFGFPQTDCAHMTLSST